MIYLIILFTILFFLLAWRRLDWAVMVLIAAMPAYLIRFNILGLPSTLLEVMIGVVFFVWCITNWERIKTNLHESFKKDNKKIKVRYPFDWEIILMLLVALAAAGAAGFSPASLGVWKAYFFEPALLFIVVLNVMKGEKGREKILWSLVISALSVSLLAIYQKITGQLIDNPMWAAQETRRVVSFFGYPNAVGLYLGPIIMVMFGWLFTVIERNNLICHCGLDPQSRNLSIASKPGFRLGGRNDKKESVARNDKIAAFFISLTIILSVLSIYFAKSKGALAGVAAGLVVFGLLAGKKIRWAVVVAILIVAASILAYQPVRKLALDTATFKTFSGQIRMVGWEETWKMLKDGRLITGAGLANFQQAIAPYHAEGFFVKNDDPDWLKKIRASAEYRKQQWQPLEIYLYPHNIVLNFWSELGLAGLLLFIWIILKYLYIGISNIQYPISNKILNPKSQKYLVIGLIGAMAAIIVHGIVDVPYFKNDLAVMFWLFIAMMAAVNAEKQFNIIKK